MPATPHIECPYCDRGAWLVDSVVIYGRSYGLMYYCRPCDAYVGVHKGTTEPLGTPANFETREARKRAHAAFDPIWQKNKVHRSDAYYWLSRQLGLRFHQTHIGMFDVEKAEHVVAAIQSHTLDAILAQIEANRRAFKASRKDRRKACSA